jgi:hypothetical protein
MSRRIQLNPGIPFKEAVKTRSAAVAVTQNTLVASNQTRVKELEAG